MGYSDAEVEAFLDHLVLQREVAGGTQALVLNTLCFLYKEVLEQPLSLNLKFIKSQRSRKLQPLAAQILIIGTMKIHQSIGLHIDNARRQGGDELAVVADEHQCAGVVFQSQV